MKFHRLYDDLSFRELKQEVRQYNLQTLRADLISGFTVSMLTIPQAMALALVAGLPLMCGVLAAIFSSILSGAFGSSRSMVAGPGNAIAVMIQAVTAEVLFTHYSYLTGWERDQMAIQILTQLSLLVGLLQVAAAVAKLGKLIQFVSHSVIVGYIMGTAFAIIVGQYYTLMGLETPERLGSLYQRTVYAFSHIGQIHWPTAVVGFGSMFLIKALERIDRRIPAPALMLAVVAASVYFVGYFFFSGEVSLELSLAHSGVKRIALVGDAGEVNGISFPFSLPYFDPSLMNHIFPVAFAIALVGILETMSVAKSIAAMTGERLSTNQEILGLGIGNFFSSFISAMPIAGSVSRSMVLYDSGAKTRFAGIFNSIFVLILVLILGPFISRIPLTSLAAILLLRSVSIVNRQQFLLCLKATLSDSFVMWTTLIACIFFSFDIAFYIGVALSIILYLKKAAVPQLIEYAVDEAGHLHNIRTSATAANSLPIRIIKIEGELFFGAAEVFQSTLQSIAEGNTDTRVIVLQMKNARDLDATSCLALRQLHDFLIRSKRHLVVCGITYAIWEVLSHADMIEQIGKQNLFIVDENFPQRSTQKAFERAKALVAVERKVEAIPSPQTLIEGEEDPEDWDKKKIEGGIPSMN